MVLNIKQLKLNEKRRDERLQLTGLLPGKLSQDKNNQNISCRPVDISKEGLGILSSDFIEPGETLTLTCGKEIISLTIVWRKEDFAKQDLYRYGLHNQKHDLIKIFRDAGCLK